MAAQAQREWDNLTEWDLAQIRIGNKEAPDKPEDLYDVRQVGGKTKFEKRRRVGVGGGGGGGRRVYGVCVRMVFVWCVYGVCMMCV